jgi:multidrug efflux pump subunit AcrB
VARIELGGENYNMVTKINGQPATGLGIKLATGANALDTAAAIEQAGTTAAVLPAGAESRLPV